MQSVLITGANRGIGLEFVKAYAAQNWQVYATCRNPTLSLELKSIGKMVKILQLDVTSQSDISQLASDLNGKAIDILINNAAIHGPRDSSSTYGNINLEAWIEVMHVNAMAPIKIAEALLPNLLMGSQKKMVFISSMAGSISLRGSQPHHKTGGPYIYRTSKAALNAAVKAIGFDLQSKGVSVVALHPGWVRTETGGWDAPGSPDHSVAAMIKLIDAATPNENGVFLNVDGAVIPW